MKKIIIPILLFMMFIPLLVNAEICNQDKISISSITIEESSDNVTEIDKDFEGDAFFPKIDEEKWKVVEC